MGTPCDAEFGPQCPPKQICKELPGPPAGIVEGICRRNDGTCQTGIPGDPDCKVGEYCEPDPNCISVQGGPCLEGTCVKPKCCGAEYDPRRPIPGGIDCGGGGGVFTITPQSRFCEEVDRQWADTNWDSWLPHVGSLETGRTFTAPKGGMVQCEGLLPGCSLSDPHKLESKRFDGNYFYSCEAPNEWRQAYYWMGMNAFICCGADDDGVCGR